MKPRSLTVQGVEEYGRAWKSVEGGAETGLALLSGFHRDQAFTLGALAGQLAGAADGFGLLPGPFFRRLFIMIAQFHFAEDAFTLHLFFQSLEGLINIIIANDYLHRVF